VDIVRVVVVVGERMGRERGRERRRRKDILTMMFF